jgi:hypothetical protein
MGAACAENLAGGMTSALYAHGNEESMFVWLACSDEGRSSRPQIQCGQLLAER